MISASRRASLRLKELNLLYPVFLFFRFVTDQQFPNTPTRILGNHTTGSTVLKRLMFCNRSEPESCLAGPGYFRTLTTVE